ncbi:MAG: dihydrofolate reductase [Bacteroidota bacterium]
MVISMIAAMGKNRVIGKDNDLPWHLPNDFKYFQQTTKGHHVIMGRKNWESLPHKFRPLPQRTNLVITKQHDYHANGATIIHSLEEGVAVAEKNNEKELFIIGGGEIYRIGLEITDKIYLTEIEGIFDGLVTFPEFSLDEWDEVSRVHHPIDNKHQYAFDFVVYKKTNS